MTMARKAKPAKAESLNNAISVPQTAEEGQGVATARAFLDPDVRHAVAATQVLKPYFGTFEGSPGVGDYSEAIYLRGKAAAKGELAFASRTLAAQSVTLDTIFTEMARRMALNMGEFLPATETYARIALKAQAQSRATLETLAKLHQPREQTVRHVHVNEGGQAVIADQFHHHEGATENGKSDKQSDATGQSGQSAALPCPDPLREGMPVPSRQRQAKVQDARRD
jgi:hypothetical protein